MSSAIDDKIVQDGLIAKGSKMWERRIRNVRMRNIVWATTIITVAMALFAFVQPSLAYAATKTSSGAKVIDVGMNIVYHEYDITGDGSPDELLVRPTENRYGNVDSIAVYINGTRAFYQSCDGFYPYAKLIVLQNGAHFLQVNVPWEDMSSSVNKLLQYKSGKLKNIVDLQRVYSKKIRSGDSSIVAVNGNAITIRSCVQFMNTGNMWSDFTYKYKSGSLKKSGSFGKVSSVCGFGSSKSFKALKKITAYKDAKCKKAKFVIRKGQKVRFVKVYASGSTAAVQVKVGKRSGWIKTARTYNKAGFRLMYKEGSSYRPPFKGLFLAG